MISSLVGSPSGFSTTTSQCSKSQPSSKIVSLGGRFDQLGFGSLSDEEVARVAKPRSAEEAGGIRRRATPAAARGRRRERVEREEAAVAKVVVVVVVVVVSSLSVTGIKVEYKHVLHIDRKSDNSRSCISDSIHLYFHYTDI